MRATAAGPPTLRSDKSPSQRTGTVGSATHNLGVANLLYRVEQRKRMYFKWLLLGKSGVDDVRHESADSSDIAVSVAMAHWNVEHRVFVVEQFVRNSDSVVAVQRLFRRKFNVERRGAIPDRNTILRWVEAFKCY